MKDSGQDSGARLTDPVTGLARFIGTSLLMTVLVNGPARSTSASITADPASCLGSVAGSSLRFAVIGDYGLAGRAEREVAALVTSWSPDLILTVGDNNYPSGAATTIDANIGQYYHEYICNYRGVFGAGAATNKFLPALGNHDWRTRDARAYLDYFTLPGSERYYDHVHGPVHFFILDSDWHEPDGIGVSSVQAAWLQAALAASTSAWDLVLLHAAPFTSGSLHGPDAAVRWPFEQWGAEAVISGHEHSYERILFDEFPYFVNGLGGGARYDFARTPVEGSEVRYNGNYGAMLVDATQTSIEFQFITRSGALVDTYSLHQPPPAQGQVWPASAGGTLACLPWGITCPRTVMHPR